jgi:glutamyl-Q tRNA(Asp) synthetase
MMVTRFAPSPTGWLHLGHAYTARCAWEAAQAAGGRFLLRIEDIDVARCRPEYEEGILRDLAWLGYEWDPCVWRQSERMDAYAQALESLRAQGLLYPCFCTRAELAAAAPHGDAATIYPGTCRGLEQAAALMAAGASYALRLDVSQALAQTGPLTWTDRSHGTHRVRADAVGDVVLARKDCATSYHLAVVVDDAAQEVTLVTRGDDLLSSTPIHRLLQALLDLPVPVWQHHRLVADESGVRMAKRHESLSLRHLRETARLTVPQIWEKLRFVGDR